MKKRPVLFIVILLLFLSLPLTQNSEAGYGLSISGKDFFEVTPFQSVQESSHVRIYLDETSEGPLNISISTEGDFVDWISFGGQTSFTLYPDESVYVPYNLSIPALIPGKYEGSILAIGDVPGETDGLGAIAKPVVAIEIVIDAPTDVQIYDLETSRPGTFADTLWSDWGDSWSTTVSIINAGNDTFDGYCNITLSDGNSILEYENYTITNISGSGGTSTHVTDWNSSLNLSSSFIITARVTALNGTGMDEEYGTFSIPSPAEIITVDHTPDVVFEDQIVEVAATTISDQSVLELHWTVNGGSEQTITMDHPDNYLGNIPGQTRQSVVNYWVTSTNGAFTDRSPDVGAYEYFVYSPTVPDLVISEGGISFTPINPLLTNMNESENGTNIWAFVNNTGFGTALDIKVEVYDYDTLIFSGSIPSLGLNDSDSINFHWVPSEGDHVLRFDVDPDNEIFELDEDNNDYSITVHIYPPIPPPPVKDDTTFNAVPYIVTPIVLIALLLLLILIFKRKSRINVLVLKARPFTSAKDGETRFRYNCGYAEDARLGNTGPTTVKAAKGDIIEVEPTGLAERRDGRIVWQSAKVIKLRSDLDAPDSSQDILKKIKKKDSK